MFENNENVLKIDTKNNADLGGEITLEENGGSSKSFTQEQVDEIVKTRLARALKNMPSKEELLEFENLKKLSEENEATIKNLKAESEKNMQRLLTYERNEITSKRGINEKFRAFALFEAEKLICDEVGFEDALEKVIEENPWLTSSPVFKTGLSQGSKNTGISGLEESFYKRNPNLREN